MSKVCKKMLLSVTAVFVLVVFNGCYVEAKSLMKGLEFRQLNGRDIIRIVSSDELEIEGGMEEGIILGKYTIDGDRMRIVVTAFGTTQVRYYKITSDGLVDEKSGEVYYSKDGLVKKRVEDALEQKRKEEKIRKVEEELKLPLEKRMVFVKGGCYQMGDTFGDGDSDEKPVHEVCVDDFYMGKYEVTQKEWVAIMGSNPSYFKDCDNCPVENVSWNDAQEFINKLNNSPLTKGVRGLYRLPTEAEWEYAARSGGKNEKYAGGNALDSVAWHNNNSGSKTHPVGQKQPNGLGIYDMSGNVWEWVNDWYDSNYYKNSPKNNPGGASSGQYRVLRGGSWGNSARSTRTANRYGGDPVFRDSGNGFRCVRTE